MNTTELAVAALVLLWALVGLRRSGPGVVLAALAAGGGVLLVVGSRWRWQLVPLLVAVLVVVLLQVTQRDPVLVGTGDGEPGTPVGGSPDERRRRRGPLLVALVALTALLSWALPVPTLRLEEGSPPVGTVAFDLVDPTRTSPSETVPPDAPRRITVQAWWPAGDDDGEALALTDDGPAFAAAAGDFLGWPPLVLGHLDTIRTTAHVGAAPAGTEQLPVVVSLHGWGGLRFAQVSLLEQLAADGALVLAIDHTHGALAAQPVAGGVVPIDEQLLPDHVPPAVYAEASTVLEDTFRGDGATLLRALREADVAVPQDVLVQADLDRLVLMGHSTGGGAAVWLCAEEPACDGVLTWDPWVEPLPPARRDAPPTVPWLSVLSEEWVGNDNDAVLRPMVAAAADAELLAIERTEHRDVTVQPLLSPLTTALGIAGELPKERVDEVALQLTRAFLADVLGVGPGDPTDLEALPADVVAP